MKNQPWMFSAAESKPTCTKRADPLQVESREVTYTCLALGAWIEVELDVIHPVQKGTMDEVAIAREYGDKLTSLVGIDLQHIFW